MDKIDALIKTEHDRWVAALLFGLVALVLCLTSTQMFYDGDTNWHVATGLWSLEHGHIPATDPFSFTAVGRKWITHEWLSELAMGLAFKGAGWGGVRVLISLAFAGGMVLFIRELLRSLNLVPTLLVAMIPCRLLFSHVLARPHVLVLPLMAICMIELLAARRQDRLPSLWLLPMMTLWSNLHGSYIFGLAFMGFFGLEALVDTSAGRLRTGLLWAAYGAAALACSVITPNFIDGLVYPFYVMNMADLQAIDEWKPANFSTLSELEVLLVATIFLLFYKKLSLGLVRILLLLTLLHMTLQHVRQEFILAFVGPLLLAEPLGRALTATDAPAQIPGKAPDDAGAQVAAGGGRGLAVVAVIAVAVVLAAGLRLAIPEGRVDSETTPVTALAHVPAEIRSQPVFNDYSFGGWLIFNHVRPFMDGRSDMYGDALFRTFLDTWRGEPDAIARTFAKYRIGWVIAPPSSTLIHWAAHAPDWRRLYQDKWAAVYVRRTPLPAS